MHGIEYVLTALLHVVVGADRHGFEIFLRSDDMLHGVSELLGQPTVRDEHESDHSFWAPVMALDTGLMQLHRRRTRPVGRSAILSTRSSLTSPNVMAIRPNCR